MEVDEIRKVRVEKLQALASLGEAPYGRRFPVSHRAKEVLDAFPVLVDFLADGFKRVDCLLGCLAGIGEFFLASFAAVLEWGAFEVVAGLFELFSPFFDGV